MNSELVQTPTPSLPVGSILRDRYRIQQVLADRMGCVYQAIDLQSDTVVILKEARTRAEEFARLVAERETLIRLDHPGVMRVLDFFTEADAGYLVLERVDGISLLEYLETHPGPVDEGLLVDWAVQLAEILCYLHSQAPPVIYRDLKPEHALLHEGGRLLLIDFGIARIKKGGPRDTTWLGTPGYAAPEQYGIGLGESDERTDVYGLGATLFHLATRHLVHEVTAPASMHRGPAVPDIREFVPQYSEGLARVVRKALSPQPADRYPSAQALLRELRKARVRAAAPPLPWAAALVGLVGSGALAGCAAWLGIAGRQGGAVGSQGLLFAGLGVLCGSLLAGIWGRARGRASLPLLAMGCGLLGGAMLLAGLDASTVSSLAAHLRRLALNEMPPGLQAPLAMWTLAGAWLGAVAWGGVEMLRRPRPVAGLVLAVLLLGGIAPSWHSAALSRVQDLQVPSHVDFSWKVLWQRDMPSLDRLELGRTGHAAQGEGGFVLVHGTDARLRALERDSGRLLWERAMPRHRTLNQVEKRLYLALGHRVVAWSLEDGKEAWSHSFDAEPEGAAVGRDVLVVQVGGEWRALDIRTGGELWRCAATGALREEWQGRMLEVDEERGRVGLLDLGTRKKVWAVETGRTGGAQSFEPEAGVVVWATAGEILGLELATGAVRYRLGGPRPGARGPLAPPWMQRVPGTSIRLVAAGSRMVAFDVATGRETWTASWGLEMADVLFVDRDCVLVGTEDGRLLCLDAATGAQRWERWKRGAVHRSRVIGRDAPPFLQAPACYAYQDPGSGDVMILDGRQGILLARVPANGRLVLKCFGHEENRLYLGFDGEAGQGRVECVLVPGVLGGPER